MRQLRAGRLLLLVLVALAGWGAPAAAQLGELPEEIIRATTIGPTQVDAIKAFVDQQVTDLETGDPVKLKRARQNLEGAANDPGATISFRAAYSEALVPELDRLAKSDNEVVVINAIQAAGPLATQASIALADRYRADPRPAVRYKAVAALGQTFRAIDRAAPVVAEADALRIVTNLAAGLDAESDPSVADAYVRALIEASKLEDKFQNVPNTALEALVQSVGARLRKLGAAPADQEMLKACIRAAEEVSEALLEDFIKKVLPESLVRNAGGMGGDLLAYVFRRVRAGNLPVAQGGDEAAIAQAEAARHVEFTVTQLGVRIVYSARDRLARGGSPDKAIDLAGMIGQASAPGDREFTTQVGLIIGESGWLTREPFNFNTDRFQGR